MSNGNNESYDGNTNLINVSGNNIQYQSKNLEL